MEILQDLVKTGVRRLARHYELHMLYTALYVLREKKYLQVIVD